MGHNMSTISGHILHYSAANPWLVKISASLFFGVFFSWLELLFYKKLHPRISRSSRTWHLALLESVHKPLQVFIWVMVFSLILPVLVKLVGLAGIAKPYLHPIREFVFVMTLFWFSMRFIGNTEKAIISKPISKNKHIQDRTTVRAVSQLLRVTMIVITVLLVMQGFGVKITTLLTLGGVGGIAVGFAAKDTLANFLGGMMIFWDRPFAVGDWIRSPDRSIEGTVEHIGWRLTRIRTFDKRPLYVPNGAFSTISVENPSRMLNRRIKTTIGLRYQDATKVSLILKEIEAMLRNHPEIDTNQTLMVNLFEFGPSSLNFFIYTFTKTTNWVKFQAIQQDVFLKAINIIAEHGGECAFPTTTLDIPAEVFSKTHLVPEPS